ncbi:hypothetical protein M8494_06915 [Serratia ureilytica]
MNFQQLKIIRESARCNYNLTGSPIPCCFAVGVLRSYSRAGRRLGIGNIHSPRQTAAGHDQAGKEAAGGGGTFCDANNIRRLADVFSSNDSGQLHPRRHTWARYSLPG